MRNKFSFFPVRYRFYKPPDSPICLTAFMLGNIEIIIAHFCANVSGFPRAAIILTSFSFFLVCGRKIYEIYSRVFLILLHCIMEEN